MREIFEHLLAQLRKNKSRESISHGATILESMGVLLDLVLSHRNEIDRLVREHHGRSVSVFGSVARGEETSESDVDLLVDFDEQSTLFDLLHLQEAIAGVLGTSVDVVAAKGLMSRDEHIKREAIPI
ncbi:nucleotidyltransferase family protein [Ferrimicrobium acidiphilum]|uniref:Nucleotidyltransferase family protein n=2 Tax=Acidimicrobiaceae TaxID=84994 RepID=A0ABV3Y4Z1_9ACTN